MIGVWLPERERREGREKARAREKRDIQTQTDSQRERMRARKLGKWRIGWVRLRIPENKRIIQDH